MPRLILIMMCSGFFHLTFATRRLRFFHINESDLSWTAAKEYCQKNDNASLVTVYDKEDAKFIGSYTEGYNNTLAIEVWLGLYHPNIDVETGEGTFVQPKCGAIENNGLKWFNCSDEKWFMCNESNDHSVYNISKNWCRARQHCRQNYHADLASKEEAEANGTGLSFWIRDREDEWSWQDKGCSSFGKWCRVNQGPVQGNCTRVGIKKDSSCVGLTDHGCDSQSHPFCSSGDVRIKIIEKNLPWEEAYYYCQVHHTRLLWIKDDRDQEAVVQWLNYTVDTVGDRFWIGLRQSRVFGFWIWSSDTTVGESYNTSNWISGKTPQLPMSHHCGLIQKDTQKWGDEDCSWPLPFLCEEEIEYMNT
ncbi:macrophage mannose receptor 1 [Cheilinus undulatus]|uniref:macrophage mannose receptor 1 n=1 Tax=Cheilinus undulatus TaxID=241271 RepID=UPI001BD44220|nr:macrophage mannose receptor 1 [Cheilinus undulatus]